MPLLPRWRFMTSESKALVRTVVISAILMLLALTVLRTLVAGLWPLLLVGLLLWLVFKR